MARSLQRLLDPFRARGPHVTAVLVTGVVAATVGVLGQLSHLLPGVESDTVALRFQARDSHRPPRPRRRRHRRRHVLRPRPAVAVPARACTRRRSTASAARARARSSTTSSSPSRPTARDDLALYNAVERAGNVVLATTETDARGRHERARRRREPARRRTRVAAASNLPTGPRRRRSSASPAPRSGSPSFAYATSRRAGGPALAPVGLRGGRRLDRLPRRRRARSARSRSPTSSGAGSTRRSSAARSSWSARPSPSLQDVHATPTASDDLMSGPEIQANAIWTATRGSRCASAPRWFDLLAIIALALAPALAGLRAAAARGRARRAARRRRLAGRSRSSRSARAGSSPSSGRSPRCSWARPARSPPRYLAELTRAPPRHALQRGPRAAACASAPRSCARPSSRSSAASRRRPSRATATPARTSSA